MFSFLSVFLFLLIAEQDTFDVFLRSFSISFPGKRVSIGLELAADPTMLFLDEPTSGADPTARSHRSPSAVWLPTR